VGTLVGTVLSQHTTDASADAAYRRLRERFPSWSAVADADRRAIAAAVRGAGLARTKAARIRDILRRIRRERGSVDLGFLRSMSTEDAMAYLTAFRGVGPKTAACVLLFGLGRDVMPVDTHVHRVVGRLGVVGRPATRERTFEALSGAAPRGKARSLHVNLVRHGRAVCRARAPRCGDCVVRGRCRSAPGRRASRQGGDISCVSA
jgi:endonuclease-3